MTKTFKATPEEDAKTEFLDLPASAEDTQELVAVYIYSRNLAITEKLDPETGNIRKFITGKIMGSKDGQDFVEDYEVECNKQVEIPYYIAEHLRPYIER